MRSHWSLPLPRSVETLRRGYSLETFVGDAIAGVTVGLVALPLAMAFAIASGVPPQNGIYCAVIAGFTISAVLLFAAPLARHIPLALALPWPA